MSNTRFVRGRKAVALKGLTLAIGAALASHPACAQDNASTDDRLHGEDHEHGVIEEVIVRAVPLDRDVIELSQSAVALTGEALAREVANSIGETLARQPGIANASFGQNVGRPVVRGQQGVRVGVLRDNLKSSDVSAVSQDHAVPVEPFLADQVEVLRGPSTLLYGSGAIGGVVNVVTHSIPEALPEDGFEGRFLAQGDSAADERFAAGRVDFGVGRLAMHASGFYRRTDDYEIPGRAEVFEDEDHDHEDEGEHEGEHDHEGEEMTGILENSFLDNEGGAIGVSWIGDTWRFGASYTGYQSDYGIPGGHAHEEEEEHEHEEEHEGEAHEEEEEDVTIGLETNRIDAELEGTNPFDGITRLTLNVGRTDYEHTEFEGAEVGTQFDSDTTDVRLELEHEPWAGWQGAFGGQWTDTDFSALGEEAFVPPSNTRSKALFLVETRESERLTIDAGIRIESVDIEALPVDAPMMSRDFTPVSLSLGAIWHLNDASHLSFNFARAERAPADLELFAFGPHIATQTFEVGDPDLGIETNTHLEAAWRLHEGPFTGSISIYRDDFDDYIYEAGTGEIEDGLPVFLWTQQDAEFVGGEIEARWDIGRFSSGHWQLFGFYDRVSGELSDGSNVPRLPPDRVGVGVDWDLDAWVANVTWISASDQDDTADFETPTEGFDLLNAELSYFFEFGGAGVELFVQGRNLLDEEIRNHTSFLKDRAPQIGRNVVFGARFGF